MRHPLRLLVALALAVPAVGGDGPPSAAPSDARPHDLPSVERPALGGTLRSLYGREVRRLTDHKKQGVAYVQAEYATQNHVNADGTLIKLQFPDGTVHLLRRETGEWLKPTLLTAQAPVWHPTDPGLLLYVDAEGKRVRVRRFDVTTGKSDTEYETADYVAFDSTGESDISPDGKKLVFMATTKAGGKRVLVYHREPSRLSASTLEATGAHINWVQVSNSRVLVGYDLHPDSCAPDVPEAERFYEADAGGRKKLVGCQPLRVYDTEMRPAWPGGRTLLASYWGHGDVGQDATDGGREVWVMANASAPVPRADWFPGARPPGPPDCESSIVRFALDRPGEPTCLKTGHPGLPWDLALHVALPAQPAEFAYVSTYRTQGDTQYKPRVATPGAAPGPGSTIPFQNEILRVRLDGRGCERLTHHHSSRHLAGPSTYNWQPRASVDGRSRFVLFNSNFGDGDSNLDSDVYLVELGPAGPLSH